MHETLIETMVIDTARDIFKAPDLAYDADTVFQDIRDFDSIRAVQFILAVEAAAGVMFTEEEVDNMRTMGDLVGMLNGKVAAK
jgi:acyl carrier protein